MNKKEFASFAMAMKTYYSKENLFPNEQAMELWFREVEDIPYAIAEASLRKWVALNKWSPSIAEIRETAATIASGDIPDWGNGWEQVVMAIRKIGMYRIPEALDSLDPITRECVERLGFRNLCLSENINSDRANFRMIYESIAERKKKDIQVPSKVCAMIENIRSQNLMLEGKEY